MEIKLKRDKETLNTFRFTAVEGSPITGSLYVPKADAVAGQAEIKISVQ